MSISAAELAEMPLYSIACHAGMKSDALRKALEQATMLCKKWNCGNKSSFLRFSELMTANFSRHIVLVLDHAHTFLEERSLADVEKDSLASGMIL